MGTPRLTVLVAGATGSVGRLVIDEEPARVCDDPKDSQVWDGDRVGWRGA